MDSVAPADSSAGISVCEEYNLADRPPPPQPQSPRPEKRSASPHPKPATAPDRHKRAPDEGHNAKTGEAPRGRTRELSVRRKPKPSVLKLATWSNIVLNMPLHSDLRYVTDFAKYLGLASTRRDTPSTGKFRNVLFLGWGADFEKEFMDDQGYIHTHLDNLLVRVNGQTIFKDANPGQAKSALDFVVGTYFSNDRPIHLHNGGNDARWEVWSTLKAFVSVTNTPVLFSWTTTKVLLECGFDVAPLLHYQTSFRYRASHLSII